MSMNKTKKMTTIALLFALAMVLSFVEGMITPLFALPPGVKLGLANIVVMYCMVYMGLSSAVQVSLLKALF
ncbi:MAG: Gx transporter family protein, partial [Oscillospiraceae bacterium]